MTIFSKIIQGDIPSYKIYEDDLTYCFLNINQPNGGNILIVPKIEIDHFFELDDIYYYALFATAKKLAPVLKKVFDSQRVGLMIEGLEVPHVHVKMFPIFQTGDVAKSDNELKLSHDEMLAIQEKICLALE